MTYMTPKIQRCGSPCVTSWRKFLVPGDLGNAERPRPTQQPVWVSWRPDMRKWDRSRYCEKETGKKLSIKVYFKLVSIYSTMKSAMKEVAIIMTLRCDVGCWKQETSPCQGGPRQLSTSAQGTNDGSVCGKESEHNICFHTRQYYLKDWLVANPVCTSVLYVHLSCSAFCLSVYVVCVSGTLYVRFHCRCVCSAAGNGRSGLLWYAFRFFCCVLVLFIRWVCLSMDFKYISFRDF